MKNQVPIWMDVFGFVFCLWSNELSRKVKTQWLSSAHVEMPYSVPLPPSKKESWLQWLIPVPSVITMFGATCSCSRSCNRSWGWISVARPGPVWNRCLQLSKARNRKGCGKIRTCFLKYPIHPPFHHLSPIPYILLHTYILHITYPSPRFDSINIHRGSAW